MNAQDVKLLNNLSLDILQMTKQSNYLLKKYLNVAEEYCNQNIQ
ncbi:hypothetical protein [Staphylococcus epidermidis]|nr:hypothetical protein [Staphylococcus epidermidis]